MKLKSLFAVTLLASAGFTGCTYTGKTLNPGGNTSVDFFRVANERAAKERGKNGENLLPCSSVDWKMLFGANKGSVIGDWNSEWAKKETEMRKLVTHSTRQENKISIFNYSS